MRSREQRSPARRAREQGRTRARLSTDVRCAAHVTLLLNRTFFSILALSLLVSLVAGVYRFGMSMSFLWMALMTVVSALALLNAAAFAAPRWFQITVGTVGALDAVWIAAAWVSIVKQADDAGAILFFFLGIQVAASIAFALVVGAISWLIDGTPNKMTESDARARAARRDV